MTTEARERELEDLIAFVQSVGWRRFCVHAQSRCGDSAYRQRSRAILASLPAERATDASALLLQLEARISEVDELMNWPALRIKQLTEGAQR